MKILFRWRYLAFLCLIALFASCYSEQKPDSIALMNVTIIDMRGGPPQKDMAVLIVGNRIDKIDQVDRIKLPKDASVLDASGKYLIPGLWDMHVHLCYYSEAAFPLLIKNGITGVRDMGGDLEQIDQWQKEIDERERIGPRIIRSGLVVDGPKPDVQFRLTVTNTTEVQKAVAQLKQSGVDFIKIHNKVPPDAYFVLAEEANKLGISFVGHIPYGVSATEASAAGQKSIEHTEVLLEAAIYQKENSAKSIMDALDRIKGEKAIELFKIFVKNDTWYIPTLVGYRSIVAAAENEESRAGREMLLQEFINIVGTMHGAGVNIMAGTDFNDKEFGIRPGYDLHDELSFFVEAGLTPLEALQTATLKPAEFLGKLSSYGTVEEGKIADLILLEKNPLDDIGNVRKIQAVILHGKLIPLADL